MDDQVKHELMIVVERAVRPVRASNNRKRRMREELLGHLSAVFENEMELQSDVATGLERAKRRFGDPSKLTVELQRTVPWWDRVTATGEIMNFEPGESMTHFFAKCVVFALAMGVVTLLAVLPAVVWGKAGNIGFMLHVILVISFFSTIFTFLFVFTATRIGLALYGDKRQRSKWTAARCMLAALLAFPVLFLLTYMAMSGDLGWSLARLWLACYLSPVFTLLLLPMSRLAADEFRHEAQWASLELDD